ncbi:MAG: type II toxin-antitoxin system VapC family toxin [Phycisphaerae bacterium]|nr:type II toxin-antitoxin system VapC family toxin [Phycisphaerae bacterium]
MVYVDTSVLVAYYVPEAKSLKAQKAVSKHSRITISSLVEVEMFSALSRRVRTGELNIFDARKIASLFELHLEDRLFDIVPISAREYHIAREWISQFSTPLRTLDALHLAAAFCNSLTLLTADEQLTTSAKELGVAVKSI